MRSVISHDGTAIGYDQLGQGPGVVLVQGAMGTAANYQELAQNLSRSFRVYVPDRRGRGMSPREYSPGHCIQRDVEDLESLLSHTGAHFVFGLSSGAVIALEASRTLTAIHKVALYEPPFQPRGMSKELIARFNGEVEQARLAADLSPPWPWLGWAHNFSDWCPAAFSNSPSPDRSKGSNPTAQEPARQ